MRLLNAVTVFLLLFLGSCTSESLEETPVLEAENVLTIEQDLLDIVNTHRLRYIKIQKKYKEKLSALTCSN